MVTILRDSGLSDLVESEEVERLADGFQFTEGPLWQPDGSLLFQDIKAERTYRLAPDRSLRRLRENTGAANGQTFGADGVIVFCEQNGRRVSRMSLDGSDVETVVETWAAQRLNSPNDVVCRSDGLVYFTDPPYGVEPGHRSLHFSRASTLLIPPETVRPRCVCWPMTSKNRTAWRSLPARRRYTSAIRDGITSGALEVEPLRAR